MCRNVCVCVLASSLSADLSAGGAYQSLCSSKTVKSGAVGSVTAKTVLRLLLCLEMRGRFVMGLLVCSQSLLTQQGCVTK